MHMASSMGQIAFLFSLVLTISTATFPVSSQPKLADESLREFTSSFWLALEQFFLSVDWVGQWWSTKELNYDNAKNYTFNSFFCDYTSGQTALQQTLAEKISLHVSLGVLETLAIQGLLTEQNKTFWQPFASQLVYSYGNETAAVAYSEEQQRWFTCGFVNTSGTLLDPSGSGDSFIKMCASLEGIGIDEPDRDPIAGKDYYNMTAEIGAGETNGTEGIIEDEMGGCAEEDFSGWSFWSQYNDDDGDDGDDVQRWWKNEAFEANTVSRNDYVDVNLFDEPETVVEPGMETALTSSYCSAFCTTSAYIMSGFCMELYGSCY